MIYYITSTSTMLKIQVFKIIYTVGKMSSNVDLDLRFNLHSECIIN